MADDAWKRRFSAPRIDDVRWAGVAPDRLGVVSTESGSSQAWAWDLASGERRQVSSGGVGAEEVHVTPDGEAIVWWLDPLGDERGRWMVTPFRGGEATPLLPDVADAWMAGLSLAPGAVAAGFSTDDDYVIVLARNGGPARPVYRHERPAGVGCAWPQGAGGLSSDGALLCFRHAEQSDIAHPAVRILDLASGASVGELFDEGRSISPVAWSPIPGDERLVMVRELGDRLRPWLWDVRTGALVELAIDLPGDIARAWWYPDGTALLLHHDYEAQTRFTASTWSAVRSPRSPRAEARSASRRPTRRRGLVPGRGRRPPTRMARSARRAGPDATRRGCSGRPAVGGRLVREPGAPADPGLAPPDRTGTGHIRPSSPSTAARTTTIPTSSRRPALRSPITASRSSASTTGARRATARPSGNRSGATSASRNRRTSSPASTTSWRAGSSTRSRSSLTAGRGAATWRP